MNPALRMATTLSCVVASGLALYNVYADNADVIAQAEKVACGSPGCSLKKIKEERSPFSQTFGFQTELEPPRSASVSCRRQFLLAGDYTCEGQR